MKITKKETPYICLLHFNTFNIVKTVSTNDNKAYIIEVIRPARYNLVLFFSILQVIRIPAIKRTNKFNGYKGFNKVGESSIEDLLKIKRIPKRSQIVTIGHIIFFNEINLSV